MRVFRSLADVPRDARNSAVSIGNFDGLHEGHKRLLARNRELGRAHGWPSSVLTFDPHPSKVVAPQRAPVLLTTIEQRLRLIREEGIDQVFVLPFDHAFSQLTPEEFARAVLVTGVGAKAVLVGDNFRFGIRQTGDVGTLRFLGERLGFLTETVPPAAVRGRIASSSEVRELILSGNVSMACRLLGRPCSLEGNVVSGYGIGSKQTVPTLNLQTEAEVLPKQGVYVTRTRDLDSDRTWPSVTNVGYRPTFDGDRLTIETYLLSAPEGAAPEHIAVEFLHRIREERKFGSADELKQQILKDVGRAQTWFRRLQAFRRNDGCVIP